MYPVLSSSGEAPDQRFRLARISELYLAKEVEERRKMQKKYQRAIKVAQGVSAGVGAVGLGMETAGIALVATGVGSMAGIALAGLGAGAFVVDLVCGVISRKCGAKASKHASVEMAARTKLNSVHQMISKALVDGLISDSEFQLVTDEVDKYITMKDAIRNKARSTTDEAAKNEWIERGREEVRAEFAKYMATEMNCVCGDAPEDPPPPYRDLAPEVYAQPEVVPTAPVSYQQ